ncbi:hypothetical protein GCM10007887_04190 [Methylobacterium haplocladii]|uniref:Uncharacterized protein n=1 Tax=Methylobacterium haplocladii TaxID=1176176 RepID=A0A512ISC7_9HYPH|nr:hypothetical protein MHA02_30020 [Methylobacterium haplocladii]GLS57763.1 hypothetical protein GCM10007887_04190 [Methylobacterium haplocladii]
MIVCAPYGLITGLDEQAYATAADCLGYLAATLARRPVGSPVEALIADGDLGGHRLVRRTGSGRVALASCDDPRQADSVLGLTLGAALADATVDVLTCGPVEEPSWNYAPGPAFLGPAGTLVQIPPEAGFRFPVGTFVTPSRLILALGPAVILAS